MTIKFLGAAREVTGSCYALTEAGATVLIDAGLFQGTDDVAKNLASPDINLAAARYLVLTHAHLDHTGRIGSLIRHGFNGKIIATAPTIELTKLIIEDAAHLAHEKNRQILKIFDLAAIINRLNSAVAVKYNQKINLGDLSITLIDSGHILGSGSVIVETPKQKVIFSGDIGNPPVPLLNPPQSPEGIDYAIIESTYGGRVHESADLRKNLLAEYIGATLKNQGTILIPVFAVERTQEILSELNDLINSKRLPRFPVYLDSPMAIRATRLFTKYQSWFNPGFRDRIMHGDDPFWFPGLKLVKTTEESKAINLEVAPKLIIAGSGMLTGGRILHHLKHWGEKSNTLLLIIGYLVKGTLGRKIYDGTRNININGNQIRINATVKAIGAYSAHADQPKLIDWLAANQSPIKKVFIIHGELDQSKSLGAKINNQLGIPYEIPALNSICEI